MVRGLWMLALVNMRHVNIRFWSRMVYQNILSDPGSTFLSYVPLYIGSEMFKCLLSPFDQDIIITEDTIKNSDCVGQEIHAYDVRRK